MLNRLWNALRPTTVADDAAAAQSGDERLKVFSAAASSGDVAAIERLIAGGVPVDAPLQGACTAMLAASANGHVDALRFLVNAGASLMARSDDGSTCLHWASMNGTVEALEYLVAAGANPEATDDLGRPPVFLATVLDRDDVLTFWLDRSNDLLNFRDAEGRTLLHHACALGKESCLRTLLQRGALLELRNREGETPLLSSLSHSQRQAAENLIAAGASVHALGTDRSSALHHAVWGGLLGVARRLIDAGLDVNAKDASGGSALQVAARRGFPRIQQMLIDHGADTTIRTSDGKLLSDLEAEGAGLRQVTEELALFDQLPDEITLMDAYAYVRIYDELEIAEATGTPEMVASCRRRARMLLEDQVFQYKTNPDRAAGKRTVPVSETTERTRKLHPGEDPN